MAEGKRIDGRRQRGDQTRRVALEHAVRIAAEDGFEGLSFGSVATLAGISKSGVQALFGSKEALQLATLDAATKIFVELVVEPSSRDDGLDRLEDLCLRWLDYAERQVFPGGCLLVGALVEQRARPGPLATYLAGLEAAWVELLRRNATAARERGELRGDADISVLVFELRAAQIGATVSGHGGDEAAFAHARAMTAAAIRRAGPRPAPGR